MFDGGLRAFRRELIFAYTGNVSEPDCKLLAEIFSMTDLEKKCVLLVLFLCFVYFDCSILGLISEKCLPDTYRLTLRVIYLYTYYQ
jgi:hypothetical protein